MENYIKIFSPDCNGNILLRSGIINCVMASTGVAVFAYNRPDHLRRVISGLQQNDVDHLYVFADGAENNQDKWKVSSVKNIIDQIEWCRTTVTARDRNIGLAESLTSGIERVFEDHEQIIVLGG